MKIAIDIDAVLADFLSMFLKYRNDTYGTSWKRKQFYTYVWAEVFGESKEKMYSVLVDFFSSDYLRQIEPMPGAAKGVKEISKKNRLYIVTSRPRIIADITRDWLNKYFPEIFEKIYFSNQPAYGSFGSTKGEICHQTGADLFIDDQYKYCQECEKEGIKVLLFDNPWNKEDKLPKRIIRVFSWPEIVEIIKIKNSG